MNEIGEPFVVGLGLATLWVTKSLVGYVIPLFWNSLPDYWTPIIMVIPAMFLFILIRPLYIETTGKTVAQIRNEYSTLKYKLCCR